MKNLAFTNLAVFFIFFGLALIEAVRQRDWGGAFFFFALGALSLFADMRNS